MRDFVRRSHQEGRMTKPVKARPLNSGDEAWFYKNPKSIDIYCYRRGAATLSCRITRRQLEAWMKATEAEGR